MEIKNAKVIVIGEVKKGTSKSGKDWQSMQFVCQTDEAYNNTYPIEIFGEEKIENFNKYTKVNDRIDVNFNVSASEYEGKWYTKLSYWKSFKANSEAVNTPNPADQVPSAANTDDLPF